MKNYSVRFIAYRIQWEKKRGQRGRGKQKQSHKKSQRYKIRANNIKEMKNMVERKANDSGFIPVQLDVQDESGNLMKISFGDNDSKEGKVSEDDLEEMLFILDSFNISHKGFHEIAQRYPNVPRLCTLKKLALNSECPVREVNTKYGDLTITGVVRSLTECLTKTLSDPQKSNLIQNDTVSIKISGDGTRAGKQETPVKLYCHYSRRR